jgi:hypothetical protein
MALAVDRIEMLDRSRSANAAGGETPAGEDADEASAGAQCRFAAERRRA